MRKSLFHTTFLIEMPGSEPGSTWFRKVSFSKLLFSLGDSHQASLVPNLVPVGSAKSYCEAACGNVGLVWAFSRVSLDPSLVPPGSEKRYFLNYCFRLGILIKPAWFRTWFHLVPPDPSLVPPGSEKRYFSKLLFLLRGSDQSSLVPNLVPLGSARSEPGSTWFRKALFF